VSTPVSSLTPYCTASILLTYYDARQVGDLLYDTTPGQRATEATILQPVTTQTPPNSPAATIANAINWASGEIESACLVAGKYSVQDLQSLTGMALASLQGLCADLAFWKLVCRRYPKQEMPDAIKWAFEKLERLRSGERIFGLEDQIEAGTPYVQPDTFADIQTRDLTTFQASRFFGRRANVARTFQAGDG
jgi:hypothetical protein